MEAVQEQTGRGAPASAATPSQTPQVLVTEGEGRAVLAACRSLKRAGCEVSVVASKRPAASQWSRACDERLQLPNPLREHEGFVRALQQAVACGRYDLLIVGGDASLLAISERRALLEPHVAVGLPSHEAIVKSLDKLWLVERAAAVGIPSPPTIVCSGQAEALAASQELGFPLVLKPRSSVFEIDGHRERLGSALVVDPRALERLVPLYGDPILLQGIVPGSVLSYAGVRADGRVLAVALSRYLRTWYPDAGNAACSETIAPPPELTAQVDALLEELDFEGIFELELISRPDGGFTAIDLNPRPYGSMALASAAGADLPAIWCERALAPRRDARVRPHLNGHGPPTRTTIARAGVRYRWEDAELKYAAWQLRHRAYRRALAALAPSRRAVYAHFRLGDPGPLVARAIRLVRGGSWHFKPDGPASVPTQHGHAPHWRRRRMVPAQAREARSVAVIGAGPYGLAATNHLRAAGVETRVFGGVMEFWREQMPEGMMLRSRKRSSSISDPQRTLTIDDYERSEKRTVTTPSLTLEEFLDYARWYQRSAVDDVDPRRVRTVAAVNGGFTLELDDGETIGATNVVVAAGLAPFGWRPPPFDELSPALVSHTADHRDLAKFSGKRVLVVGGGQSAIESAALLHEAGAHPELLARRPSIYWLGSENGNGRRPMLRIPLPPTDVGGRVTGWLAAVPDAYRRVPAKLQPEVMFRCIRPAGAGWLRERVASIPFTLGRTARAVDALRGGGVRVRLDDDTERTVDHVLLATGYRIDVRRYPFLAPKIARSLDVRDGYPVLRPGFESSQPGLHFVGAPSAFSFGPIVRFVVGTWYSAPTLAAAIAGRPQRPLRRSF